MIKNKNRIWWLIFIAIIAIAYFAGLGDLPFLGPDEPRYAEVAREMFERNDFVTPTLGGLNWFEKPALAYWLMIIGYKLFGINEFAARFGSAVCGLLTILAIYLICQSATNQNNENSQSENQPPLNDFPFWALLASASSIGLLAFSRAATFDIVLTFSITAALACFFAFDINYPQTAIRNSKWLIGFYFFIGLALLAKGLIGAILPFGIIFWYFVWRRKYPSATFIISLLWGTLLTLSVAALWYAPMFLRHGREFFNEFFVQQQFARYASNKYLHPEPFWFFWAVLPALTLPWLPFLFVSIWKLFFGKTVVVTNEKELQIGRLRIFAFVWMVIPLVFFTFSGSKLPGYILPALPAALILAAEQINLFAQNNRKRTVFMQTLAAIILLLVPISINMFALKWTQNDTTKFLLKAADEQDLNNAKVLNLHDISHSLEFYAAGRLVRLPDGKQWKFEGVGEIWNYLELSNEQTVLVLVPLEHEHQLYETNLFTARRIAANTGFALVAVAPK